MVLSPASISRTSVYQPGGQTLYLDTPGQCGIEDRGWRRRIIIEKHGAASTVVWNRWAEEATAMVDLGDPAWREMVCVETGNVADNGHRGADSCRLEVCERIAGVTRNRHLLRVTISAGAR
jgi:D-hexose-6-phosphate mutarotase